MSFAYMPIFTGDYLRDTRHLSPLRHGVYLLALMHCWDSKGPMPLDEQESAGICNCRSSDEIEALRYILGRYFVKMDDGHYNKRMAEEVAKTERLSGAFREAGLRSAEARRAKARGASAKAEPTFNQGSTEVEPRMVSPSPSPSPSSSNDDLPSVEAPRKRAAPKPKASKRCPQDFEPDSELIAWVLMDCPGVNWARETASFKDWEFKTARSDWPATWRSWMRKAFDSMQQRRAAGPESFRAQDERIAAESVRRLTGGLAHNRAAVGEAPPRELLPFEAGYVKPKTDTIEGSADVRRIR